MTFPCSLRAAAAFLILLLAPCTTSRALLTGDVWTNPTAPLSVKAFTDVTMKGTEYWAVSEAGVYKSTNLTAWSKVTTSGLTDILISIRWTGTRFVGVGLAVWTSVDGITWVFRDSFSPLLTLGLAVKGTTVVAVGILGAVLLSTDGGVTWELKSQGDYLNFSAVTATTINFVAVGEGGVIYTSPDGATWTPRSSNTSATLWDVTVAGPRVVAVGDNATVVTSVDHGQTWSAYAIPGGAGIPLNGVAGDAASTVMCGPEQLIIRTTNPSNPALLQILPTPQCQAKLLAVARSATGWACVGQGGTILTSTDGNTWTLRAPAFSYSFFTGTRTSTHFFTAGYPGDKIARSTDGVTWGLINSPLAVADNQGITSMAWAPSPAKLVVGTTGGRIYSSTASDGTGLGLRSSGTTNRLNAACWTGSMFIMAGENGALVTSPNGNTWTVRNSGVPDILNAAASNGTRHVVCGGNFGAGFTSGRILTSTDGIAWFEAGSPDGILFGVAWNGSLFVAVGWDGLIMTSPDGLDWTTQYASLEDEPYTAVLTTVVYAGSNWIICDAQGSALLSTDAVNWKVRRFAAGTPVNAMMYGASKAILAGEAGEILASVATAATAPVILVTPFSATVEEFSGNALSVLALGTPDLRYQWRKNGVDLDGETKSIMALLDVLAEDSGVYDVIVTNDAGTVTSPPATFRVRAAPYPEPFSPDVVYVEEGQEAVITATVGGAGPITYQWKKFGSPDLAGQTSATLRIPAVTPAAAGEYFVVVANQYGSEESEHVFLVVLPSLANALDLPPGTTVTTGGALPWKGTADDVAECTGGNAPGDTAWMDITVTDKLGVSFDWRVESDSPDDKLEVFVDGIKVATLYDSAGMRSGAVATGPGAHTVRWIYTEDDDVNDFSFQSAQVDNVVLLSGNVAPLISVDPEELTVREGDPAVFRVLAVGTAPLTYQWTKGGQPVTGVNGPTLTLPAVTPADAVAYFVTVTNAHGNAVSSTVWLTVLPSLRTALDLPAYVTQVTTGGTGGAEGWSGVSNYAQDNTDSAESGVTPHSGSSWLQVTVSGVTSVSFWRAVSSEFGGDALRFTVDGVNTDSVSGLTFWEQKSFPLDPRAPRVLRWTFARDSTLSGGTDRAWLDQVQFTLDATADFPLWAAAINLPAARRGPKDRNGPFQMENMVAYALGINPLTATPADLPYLSKTGDSLFLYHTRKQRAEGIRYDAEWSVNPSGTWSTTGVVHTLLGPSGDTDLFRADYTPPPGTPRVYLRLRITFTGG